MNLPTLISISRGMLCLCFLSDSSLIRTLAITIAALTDFLDGFLARRFNQTTPLGTLLDPLMDKLFVAAALFVFWSEEKVAAWQITLFLLRDLSLLIFSLYLWAEGRHNSWQIRSFWSGKLMTCLQFAILLLLAQSMPIHATFWALLAIFGTASFFELRWLSNCR